MDNPFMETQVDVVKSQATRILSSRVSGAKNMAYEFDNPIDFLKEYPWADIIPVNKQFTQEELRSLNAVFDPRSCFGRIVLALLLVEKYFIGHSVQLAEVLQDELALRMMRLLEHEDDPKKRMEISKELLMYEEPHLVIVVDGQQFDPLSALVGNIKHPKVLRHDPWSTVVASQLLDVALDSADLEVRLTHLKRVNEMCPNLVFIKENLAAVKLLAEDPDYLNYLHEVIQIRPNARLLYMLWLECGATDLFGRYPREICQLLDSELDENLKKSGILI